MKTNADVAAMMKYFADYYSGLGEAERFKARAFYKAAEAITLHEGFVAKASGVELAAIPGLGKSCIVEIKYFVSGKDSPRFKEVHKEKEVYMLRAVLEAIHKVAGAGDIRMATIYRLADKALYGEPKLSSENKAVLAGARGV